MLSRPETDRSASAALTGFYYQFDKTILTLLGASDVDTVTIEHVEDVALESPHRAEAIQCKYLPSARLTDSVLRPPLIKMLDGFRARRPGRPPLHYRLYVHSKDGTPGTQRRLTTADLERVLRYSEAGTEVVYHERHGIPADVLAAFADHFAVEFADDFAAQQERVLDSLAERFKCDRPQADAFYYNNALRVVMDLARNPDPAVRETKRVHFLASIDTRAPLFNAWYREIRGHEKYVRSMRGAIAARKLLHPNRHTALFLDASLMASPSEVGDVLYVLAAERYPLGKVPFNTKPLTVVLDGHPGEVAATKRQLLRRGVFFEDGYEHVAFTPERFNAAPIVYRAERGGKATDAVERASYVLRVLSSDTYVDYRQQIQGPWHVVFFSGKDPAAYFSDPEHTVFPVVADGMDDVARMLCRKA